MALQITHDFSGQRFWVQQGEETAYLTYRLVDDDILDLNHTFVPPQFRGQSVAAQLTQAALEFAEQNGFKVIASCSYVDRYIDKHRQYQPLRADQG